MAPIAITLDDAREIVPLLAFLREREIDARLGATPGREIVVEPAATDPAAVEVYVALHTWVDGGGSALTPRVGGRGDPLPPARPRPLPRP